ncbi:MAG: glycosyltransferase [Cyclobacteriaceae bacterium]|nr:glycosyltransferase [Cyclobacteriaceae bacterium]
MEQKINIISVNHSDFGGGAAGISRALFEGYSAFGHGSYFLVGQKVKGGDGVIEVRDIDNYSFWRRKVAHLRWRVTGHLKGSNQVRRFITSILLWIEDPLSRIRYELGLEEFDFPAVKNFFASSRIATDVIHLHMPRGGFFDLRYLPELSHRFPVIYTLHGAWLLAGHCAHSFDCERWKTGCGKCPDLSIPVAIKRDGSRINWMRKDSIYKRSKLYVATPCKWLMDKVDQSMLAQACIERRVIPHGVDQRVFCPGDRGSARTLTQIDQEAFVFLFSANAASRNRWKDFELMRNALLRVEPDFHGRRVIFLALGDSRPSEYFSSNVCIEFRPFNADQNIVANFYRAADVYLHAAKVDTFPTSILEALSCGLPVIATDVGGIPEQVKCYKPSKVRGDMQHNWEDEEATGILVKPGDVDGFATAMKLLFSNDDLRGTLSRNAVVDARSRFSADLMIKAYLDWFHKIIIRTA